MGLAIRIIIFRLFELFLLNCIDNLYLYMYNMNINKNTYFLTKEKEDVQINGYNPNLRKAVQTTRILRL